jgi:hypothetical protein
MSVAYKLKQCVGKHPRVFSTDGKVLFCKVCDATLCSSRSFIVKQHFSTQKHICNLRKLKKGEPAQALIATQDDATSSDSEDGEPVCKERRTEFFRDTCDFFVMNDIPLCKLSSGVTKWYIKKWTHVNAPDESTVRKRYVMQLYHDKVESIRADLAGKAIWVSVDETTDKLGRHAANVVVGAMSKDAVQHAYLVHMESLTKVDSTGVTQLFSNAMLQIWPAGIQYNKVLLLVTDAAAYMKKAGKALVVTYPKMVHVTCLAHGLHNVCDEIRKTQSAANSLIAHVKSVFVKSPLRIATFREMLPNTPLPPEPVITRWGTWIAAVSYYAEHFDDVKRVVDTFRNRDAAAISMSKQCFEDPATRDQIVAVHSSYSFLTEGITQLECRTISMPRALSIYEMLLGRVQADTSALQATVLEKFDSVFGKNAGLKKMVAIRNAIEGRDLTDVDRGLISMYTPADIALFKYCPLTSCEVERTFSQYKAVLRSNRERFEFEHLKMHMIAICNK